MCFERLFSAENNSEDLSCEDQFHKYYELVITKYNQMS